MSALTERLLEAWKSTERFNLFGLGGGQAGSPMGFGRLKIMGTTPHVTRCQNCGRAGLQKTVVCAVIGDDGHPTNQYHFFGSDCAAKLAGKSEKQVDQEANVADSRRGLRLHKQPKSNEGQMELGLRFSAMWHQAIETERYARIKSTPGQLGLNFDQVSSHSPEPEQPIRQPVSAPKPAQMGLFDQPRQPVGQPEVKPPANMPAQTSSHLPVPGGQAKSWFELGRAASHHIGQSSLRPSQEQIKAAATHLGVSRRHIQKGLAVFHSPEPRHEEKRQGLFDAHEATSPPSQFDEEKHPRWEKGDKAHHGGQFSPKGHKPAKTSETQAAPAPLPNTEQPFELGKKDPESGITPLFEDEAERLRAARKWKNNGDGTYTSPNGTVWRKAKAGGEISPVTGKTFAGGALMPIHGLHVKQEPKPIGGPAVEAVPNENKPKQPWQAPKVRERSPEDIESERIGRERERKWQEIQAGPLGRVLGLGDRIHYIKNGIGPSYKWMNEAEQLGPEATKRIADEAKAIADEHMMNAAQSDAKKYGGPENELIDPKWFGNTGEPTHWKDHAQEGIDWRSKDLFRDNPQQWGITKKHLAKNPHTHQARMWLMEALRDGDQLDTLHRLHSVISGPKVQESPQESGPDLAAIAQQARNQGRNIHEVAREHGIPITKREPLLELFEKTAPAEKPIGPGQARGQAKFNQARATEKELWNGGDRIRLTGKQVDHAGAKFDEFEWIEGHRKGQKGLQPTQEQAATNLKQRQDEYKNLQSAFARLHDKPESKKEGRPAAGQNLTEMPSATAAQPESLTQTPQADKEPWQMTRAEFGQQPSNWRIQPRTGIMDGATLRAIGDLTPEQQHRVWVKYAKSRGETISPHILAEYPDLQSKQSSTPAELSPNMDVDKPQYKFGPDIVTVEPGNTEQHKQRAGGMAHALAEGIYAAKTGTMHTGNTPEALRKRIAQIDEINNAITKAGGAPHVYNKNAFLADIEKLEARSGKPSGVQMAQYIPPTRGEQVSGIFNPQPAARPQSGSAGGQVQALPNTPGQQPKDDFEGLFPNEQEPEASPPGKGVGHAFGSLVKAPDGTVGTMRGDNGLGGGRAGVIDHKGILHWHDRDKLVLAADSDLPEGVKREDYPQQELKGAERQAQADKLSGQKPVQPEPEKPKESGPEIHYRVRDDLPIKQRLHNFLRATLKPGDEIDVGGNAPIKIAKVNEKSVKTEGGAIWKYGEFSTPSIASSGADLKQKMEDFERQGGLEAWAMRKKLGKTIQASVLSGSDDPLEKVLKPEGLESVRSAKTKQLGHIVEQLSDVMPGMDRAAIREAVLKHRAKHGIEEQTGDDSGAVELAVNSAVPTLSEIENALGQIVERRGTFFRVGVPAHEGMYSNKNQAVAGIINQIRHENTRTSEHQTRYDNRNYKRVAGNYKSWLKSHGTDENKLMGIDPKAFKKQQAEAMASASMTLDDYRKHMQAVDDGKVTADEHRAAFARFMDSAPGIRAELNKLSKDEIEGWHHDPNLRVLSSRSRRKPEAVEDTLGRLQRGFDVRGETNRWTHGQDRDLQLRDAVSGIADEHLKSHAEEISKEREERNKRHAEWAESLENPKTFEDWINKRKSVGGYQNLTEDHKAAYDEAIAAERRRKYPGRIEKEKEVSGFEGGEQKTGQIGIVKGHHQKRNAPTWTVTIEEHLGDSWKDALSRARALGGNYVNTRIAKAYNATPGFQFFSEDAAKKFHEVMAGKSVDNSEAIAQREAAKREAVADKLGGLASEITGRAEDSLSRERKDNTARRARMAAGAEADARNQLAKAKSLERVSQHIADGKAVHLRGVSAGTHIDELNTLLRWAQMNHVRHLEKTKQLKNYNEREAEWDRPAKVEDVAHAEFPYPYLHKSELYDQSKKLENVPGLKLVGAKLRKLADNMEHGKDHAQITDPDVLEKLSEAIPKMRRNADPEVRRIAGRFAEKFDRMARLKRMDITSAPELRAALREYVKLKAEPEGADPLKEHLRWLKRQKVEGFFPTPPPLVEKMLEHADIEDGHDVLEPSAGTGSLMAAIRDNHPGANLHGIEKDFDIAKALELQGLPHERGDFLDHKKQYDRIVMNPPFEHRQDEKHVKHAFSLLKPGGRMVAIMGAGAHTNQRSEGFRDWLSTVGAKVYDNPEGSFAGDDAFRQTGVNTKMVIIDKPGDSRDTERHSIHGQLPEYVSRVVDTSDPQHQDQNLGAAGWIDNGYLNAMHVTDSPEKVVTALKAGNLTAHNDGRHEDLGPGLYASGVPHMWRNRSANRWDFLNRLGQDKINSLADHAIKQLHDNIARGYNSHGEATPRLRELEDIKAGKLPPSALSWVNDQPYNIDLANHGVLRNHGIEPGQAPQEIHVKAKGKFAELKRSIGHKEQHELSGHGIHGAFITGGMHGSPQVVFWDHNAIHKFGNHYTKQQPAPKLAENSGQGLLFSRTGATQKGLFGNDFEAAPPEKQKPLFPNGPEPIKQVQSKPGQKSLFSRISEQWQIEIERYANDARNQQGFASFRMGGGSTPQAPATPKPSLFSRMADRVGGFLDRKLAQPFHSLDKKVTGMMENKPRTAPPATPAPAPVAAKPAAKPVTVPKPSGLKIGHPLVFNADHNSGYKNGLLIRKGTQATLAAEHSPTHVLVNLTGSGPHANFVVPKSVLHAHIVPGASGKPDTSKLSVTGKPPAQEQAQAAALKNAPPPKPEKAYLHSHELKIGDWIRHGTPGTTGYGRVKSVSEDGKDIEVESVLPSKGSPEGGVLTGERIRINGHQKIGDTGAVRSRGFDVSRIPGQAPEAEEKPADGDPVQETMQQLIKKYKMNEDQARVVAAQLHGKDGQGPETGGAPAVPGPKPPSSSPASGLPSVPNPTSPQGSKHPISSVQPGATMKAIASHGDLTSGTNLKFLGRGSQRGFWKVQNAFNGRVHEVPAEALALHTPKAKPPIQEQRTAKLKRGFEKAAPLHETGRAAFIGNNAGLLVKHDISNKAFLLHGGNRHELKPTEWDGRQLLSSPTKIRERIHREAIQAAAAKNPSSVPAAVRAEYGHHFDKWAQASRPQQQSLLQPAVGKSGEAQRIINSDQPAQPNAEAPTNGSASSEASAAAAPVEHTPLHKLVRPWKAGQNEASIQFQDAKQRDLFDYASGISRNVKFSGNASAARPKSHAALDDALTNLANQHFGGDRDAAHLEALRTRSHVLAHMKGARDGEHREIPGLDVPASSAKETPGVKVSAATHDALMKHQAAKQATKVDSPQESKPIGKVDRTDIGSRPGQWSVHLEGNQQRIGTKKEAERMAASLQQGDHEYEFGIAHYPTKKQPDIDKWKVVKRHVAGGKANTNPLVSAVLDSIDIDNPELLQHLVDTVKEWHGWKQNTHNERLSAWRELRNLAGIGADRRTAKSRAVLDAVADGGDIESLQKAGHARGMDQVLRQARADHAWLLGPRESDHESELIDFLARAPEELAPAHESMDQFWEDMHPDFAEYVVKMAEGEVPFEPWNIKSLWMPDQDATWGRPDDGATPFSAQTWSITERFSSAWNRQRLTQKTVPA